MTTLETVKGVSKRERYDWKVADKPGEYAMINKNDLKVDTRYQRGHSKDKILKMAAEWSWVACGAISVALRNDGEWFVMDGQHRVLAALYRDDITKLPCMVFDVEEIVEEARGFLKTNTSRRPMTMVDRFKAMLMTEDHTARVVNELVISAGRHVAAGASANAFAAVNCLLTCVRDDEAAVRRIWPLLTELCPIGTRVPQTVIMGLWWLERHLTTGVSLSSTHWRKRVLSVGLPALEESIVQSANYHGGGKGYKNCALGVAAAVNKGLRNYLTHTIKEEKE